MILTCPNCGTQYVVKDGAIPPQGRQVRCAACKHGWHQDPEPQATEGAEAPTEIEATSADEDRSETIAEATLIEPRSGPEAEERAFEEAMIEPDQGVETGGDAPAGAFAQAQEPAVAAREAETMPAESDWGEPPQVEPEDDEFSPFPEREDEVEPRRRRPLVTLLAIIVLVAALAAAFWFLAPAEWKARVGLASTGASPLALVTTHMDRQRLESGNETLSINGRVINPTSKDQDVPPLQAQLKTRTGQVVYTWTIPPPTPRLPPGASASFYSTEVDVPAGGEELTITVGPPRA